MQSDYYFNNLGRIGADSVDSTQRSLSNTRYANYMLYDYSAGSSGYVDFALQQPTMMFSGTALGPGLSSTAVDNESALKVQPSSLTRESGKLSLYTRPFVTVPYLGRGWADPVIESQLQQGESVGERKSVSTVSEETNSFSSRMDPTNLHQRTVGPSISEPQAINDLALNGWVNGGVSSREMFADKMQYRPTGGAPGI
jgi:hypothetical protein